MSSLKDEYGTSVDRTAGIKDGKMELKFTPVIMQDPVYKEVKYLYEISFPAHERRDFSNLADDFGEGYELFAVFGEDHFAGLVVLLTFEDITHILYLAVKPELYGQGYGSRILTEIRNRYPGHRIIADLERPETGTPNEDQREKRIAFYQKNGYRFTEISYYWEGENYRIMSNGGDVTREEFGRFWWHFYQR